MTSYPSKNDNLQGIKAAKSFDWLKYFNSHDLNSDEKVDLIRKKLESFDIPFVKYHQYKSFHLFDKLLYRARPISSFNNREDMFNPSEYSYPPADKCNKYGRANFKSKPVFYCSNVSMVACQEAWYTAYDRNLVLSVWSNKTKEVRDYKIESFIQTTYKHNPRGVQEQQHQLANIIRQLNNYKMTDEERAVYINSLLFLNDSFLRNKDYSISSCLGHSSLYDNTDLIYYPSIPSKKSGGNIAISPSFVDNNLELLRLYEVHIKSIDPIIGGVKLDVIKMFIESGGVLIEQDMELNKEVIKQDFPFDNKYGHEQIRNIIYM